MIEIQGQPAVDDSGTGFAAYHNLPITVGNLTVYTDSGVGYPVQGTLTSPVLDLTSEVVAAGAGTLTLSITQTGFTSLTGGEQFLSSIGGNTTGGVSAAMNTYLDNSDAPFGTGTPLSSGLLLSGFPGQTGNANDPSVSNPYSLTAIITVTAISGGMASIDALIVDAPEPASLSLLSAALVVLAMVGWWFNGVRRSPRRVRA